LKRATTIATQFAVQSICHVFVVPFLPPLFSFQSRHHQTAATDRRTANQPTENYRKYLLQNATLLYFTMYDFICKWRRTAQIRPSRKKGYQKQDYLIEVIEVLINWPSQYGN